MGRRLGLIVGVNSYRDTAFRSLQFAENDARAFAQWLVNERGGKWAPADVQCVYGANATKSLVESLALQVCVAVAQPDDLVLIYIASNAFVDANTGNGYLALADTTLNDTQTGLSLLSLAQQLLPHSNAAQIVFFLDTSQMGKSWNAKRASAFDARPLLGPMLLAGLQRQQDRIFVCSCRSNDFTPEMGEQGLGLFMHSMIIGLSGAATNTGAGDVTLQNLYAYLSNNLPEQQRPQVFGQAPNSIVLVGTLPTIPQSPIFPSSYAPPMSPMSTRPASSTLSAQQSSYKATATAQMSPTDSQQTSKLLDSAMQLLQAQNPEEALRLTEQALQLSPDDSRGLTLKSQILGTMGRFPEALAAVDLLRQKEPNNALAWSMGAVLLSNMGRYSEALTAIERSLELDASNPESYAIKTNIMSSIAIDQSRSKKLPKNDLIASDKKRSSPMSFFVGMLAQLVGLLLGIGGGILPIVRPTLPISLSFALEALGLAILCVNAVRGAYLHGLPRVFITFLFSILTAAILGISVGYRPAYRQIIFELQAHARLLQPLAFLGGWLLLAAVLPLLLAIIGWISGLIAGVRRKTR